MQIIWGDLRQAVRLMRQSRTSTAVAVLSLSLAIGINASVFSLLNTVMLPSLPAPPPDQLIAFDIVHPSYAEGGFAFQAFELLVERQDVFSTLIGYWGDGIFNVQMDDVL